MPRILVFDVNETMLDLRALDPEFRRVFGDEAVRGQWFGQLLQSALVTIATDAYTDFGTIAGAALDMVAARRGTRLAADDRVKILGGILTLPAYPDAVRLTTAGSTSTWPKTGFTAPTSASPVPTPYLKSSPAPPK